MPGLVPGTHALHERGAWPARQSWMAGTGPAMTESGMPLSATQPTVAAPAPAFADRLAELNARAQGRTAAEMVGLAARELFPGRTALVTSFGAESAVLLHLVASVDPTIPVVFVDTLRLFP